MYDPEDWDEQQVVVALLIVFTMGLLVGIILGVQGS